jgi:hypothetical protein
MKRKYGILLALALVGAGLLAFLLQGAVKEGIILPLARFAWVIKGYYGAFPQSVYWVIALVAGVLLVAIGFRLPEWEKRHQGDPWKSLPGPVKELSFWILRAKNGLYPKWHIAHLLAELELDILDQRGKREKHIVRIRERDWAPSEEVEKYLDAALNTNYSDYTRPKRFKAKPPSPFDLDIEPVILFLESLLENENDHNS